MRDLLCVIQPIAAFVISALTFLLIGLADSRHSHDSESEQSNQTLRMILGGIFSLLSVITPSFLILKTNLINIPIEAKFLPILAVLGITILFIALFALVMWLINYQKGMPLRIVAYLVAIIASAIPGLLMSRFDKTASSIGAVYYVALLVLVLAYNGINMLLPRD